MFRSIAGWIGRHAIESVIKSLALRNVAEAISSVEERSKTTPGALTGACKKDEVIELLIGQIDIPYVSRKLERRIWGLVIDMVVEIFNTYIWNRRATG